MLACIVILGTYLYVNFSDMKKTRSAILHKLDQPGLILTEKEYNTLNKQEQAHFWRKDGQILK
jgi:hypothetical protein